MEPVEKYKVVTFKDGAPRGYSTNCDTKSGFEDHIRVSRLLKDEYGAADFIVAINLEDNTANVY